MFKLLILALFALVLFSLGNALFHMMRKDRDPDKVIKSLVYRIGLSLLLFVLLFVGQSMGLIQPHGLM